MSQLGNIVLAVILCFCAISQHATAEAPFTEVLDIRVGLTPGRTRVVFDLSGPSDYQLTHLDNPSRIVVHFPDTKIKADVADIDLGGTPIERISAQDEQADGLRLTFYASRAVRTEAFPLSPYLAMGDRLVIDLYCEELPDQATVTSPTNDDPAASANVVVPANSQPPEPVSQGNNKTSARKRDSLSQEWSGYLSLDSRLFFHSPAYSAQDRHNFSMAIKPEYFADWDNGRKRFAFSPFVRLDANDDERTHADIRELYLRVNKGKLLFKAGADVIFWGVTESQHLVDIINQTDMVENIDGEDKLGQPMLNIDYMSELGTWQFYYLPYFRERTFPGKHGRLRSEPPVDTSRAQYESSREEKHQDFALRWSHYIGDWDIGLAHFSGTSREPLLLPAIRRQNPSLEPFYPLIDQTSIDVQATKGAWLWKLEAIYNQNSLEDYYAYVAGFEFTKFSLTGGPADLGFLMEYHYDQRKDSRRLELAPAALQDDLYMGLRWTGNDMASTRLLAGILIDNETQSTFGNLEFSRRIGSSWNLGVEARVFSNIDENDVFYTIRNDDYIEIRFTRYY